MADLHATRQAFRRHQRRTYWRGIGEAYVRILLATLAFFALACSLAAGDRQYNERKAMHALAGIAVYETAKHFGHPKTGLVLAWSLGIAKERYDQTHGGTFRAGDVAWTGAPATFCFAVRW